jgi:hypothetical protein
MKTSDRRFGIAEDQGQLPVLTLTQEDVDAAHDETFGTDDDPKSVSLMAFVDSEWADLLEEFYRQRIVYVRSNEVMLLRFRYDYEVDLDRINTERDLLAWTLHLCGKTWMNTERVSRFSKAVAVIKDFGC